MIADRLLDSPMHAARFVSLIPFQRLESAGEEKVEVWHSMQSFLARVSNINLYSDFRLVAILKIMLSYFAICCWVSALTPT